MPLVEFVPGKEISQQAMNVGVILSGGQAPGGHNVISGLFDEIKKLNPSNCLLYGFLMGPGGLVDHNYIEITSDFLNDYRNTGGFDMIGSAVQNWRKKTSLRKDSRLFVSSTSKPS